MASPFTQEQVNTFVGNLNNLVASGQITQDEANKTIANEMRYAASDPATGAQIADQVAQAFPGVSQQDVSNIYNEIVAPEIIAGVAGVGGGLQETSPDVFQNVVTGPGFNTGGGGTGGGGTGGITDLDTSGNGVTLGGGGANVVDLITGDSGVTVGGDSSGVTLDVDLSGVGGDSSGVGGGSSGVGGGSSGAAPYTLTQTEQNYLAGLPANLQDIYRQYATRLGQGSTQGETLDYLLGQGYDMADILRASGAGQYFDQPAGAGAGAVDGTMATFDYTDFPGGIYGPGQALPNIFVPAGQQQPAGTGAPGTMIPAMAPGSQGDTGTSTPGSQTMVSPGITTYAYPQPFGEIDIFNRPNATAPTAYTPPPVTNTKNTNNTNNT